MMREAIARRAYEIYQGRGAAEGHDAEDWLKAEQELVEPLSCGCLKMENGLKVSVCLSGIKAKKITVGVEPERLIFIGGNAAEGEEKQATAIRTLTLTEAVDPASARIRQVGTTLEIALRHAPAGIKEELCAERAA